VDQAGAIDRKKLGAIVFADPAERKALEDMVFPWIRKRLQERIAQDQADQQSGLIVLDAAVMLEAGWDEQCDRIVFVDAPRPLRLERIARQRGWTEADLAARENAQLPLSEKSARADFVLQNDGTEEQLERNIERMMEFITREPS
jgi:dephospho-CoA kinase